MSHINLTSVSRFVERGQRQPAFRFLLSIIAAAVLAATHAAAQATCWRDANLERLTRQLAQERFPAVAQSLPTVAICEAQHFPPNVGGQYNSGRHHIEIPVWMLGQAGLSMNLLHELAHAQVALTGADGGVDGHGPGWIAAVLAAGLDDEAARVASYNPDAAQALAAIRRGRQGDRVGQWAAPNVAEVPAHAQPMCPPTAMAMRSRSIACAVEQRGWARQTDSRGNVFMVPMWTRVCRELQ